MGSTLKLLRGVGLFAVFLIAVSLYGESGSWSCPKDCPTMGDAQCVNKCTGEGQGCLGGAIPKKCVNCPYKAKCTSLACSGPKKGLTRQECRLSDPH